MASINPANTRITSMQLNNFHWITKKFEIKEKYVTIRSSRGGGKTCVVLAFKFVTSDEENGLVPYAFVAIELEVGTRQTKIFKKGMNSRGRYFYWVDEERASSDDYLKELEKCGVSISNSQFLIDTGNFISPIVTRKDLGQFLFNSSGASVHSDKLRDLQENLARVEGFLGGASDRCEEHHLREHITKITQEQTDRFEWFLRSVSFFIDTVFQAYTGSHDKHLYLKHLRHNNKMPGTVEVAVEDVSRNVQGKPIVFDFLGMGGGERAIVELSLRLGLCYLTGAPFLVIDNFGDHWDHSLSTRVKRILQDYSRRYQVQVILTSNNPVFNDGVIDLDEC